MPKGMASRQYTPEFKKQVIETMQEEQLGYVDTAERFGIRINEFKTGNEST